MNVPNEYVVKERYGGKWINTFFDNKERAVKLCTKIIDKGGKALWMRNTL